MPVTTYTTPTETLVNAIIGQIASAHKSWCVAAFNGTSADDLHGFLPGLRAPCAAVMYRGSTWSPLPERRIVDIDVFLVAANAQGDAAGTTIRGMIDACVAAIDGQVSGHALFQAADDSAQDIGPGVACAKVSFKIRDH